MSAIHGGDDDHIGLHLVDHPIELRVLIRFDGRMVAFVSEDPVGKIHSNLTHITKRYEFALLAINCGDRLIEHSGPAAGPHLDIPFLYTHSILHVFNKYIGPFETCRWQETESCYPFPYINNQYGLCAEPFGYIRMGIPLRGV